MAFFYAAGYAIIFALSRTLEDFPRQWEPIPFLNPDVAAGIFVGISLLVFAAALTGRVNSFRLLELGLIYEVIGAIGIEIDLLWWPAFGLWPPNSDMAVLGISWTCPWIIAFPLLVPTTPGKAVFAALTSASIRPLMLLILAAQGAPFAAAGVDAAVFVDLILPNYICVGLAIVGARVVWGYSCHISTARRLGSYQLVEKLGEGGMGEVWKAEHRMLARPAAIKLIKSDPGSRASGDTPEQAIHRFEREVQATAELRSPHTVVVYDYGFTDDRTFYYVMELLDGISLQDAVEKYGPMPAERTVHILRQACRSLAEAHKRGIVHRDIKPGNIFICRYGLEHDFVKVLDFGLVKHIGEESRRDLELTEVGMFTGTPAYGSPEAATADRDSVDARSDIYSLGCVAYWLLTGRTVFEAATSVMMLVQHVKEEPARPSQRTELTVPSDLDDLVLACLQKDRTERPEATEIVEAKLAAIDFADPWIEARAQQWWDLHLPREAPEIAMSAQAGGHHLMVG
jgi:serine/threonine-protein kinase